MERKYKDTKITTIINNSDSIQKYSAAKSVDLLNQNEIDGIVNIPPESAVMLKQ